LSAIRAILRVLAFGLPTEFAFEIRAGPVAQGQPCCLGSALRSASSNAAGTNGFVR
jgi:hypothetical protein